MQSHRIQHRSLLASILAERMFYRLLVLGVSFIGTAFGLTAPWAQKKFTEALLAGAAPEPWIFLAFFSLVAYQFFWQFNTWLCTRESLVTQKSFGDAAFARLLEGPGGLVGRGPAGLAVSLFAVDIPGAGALLEQSLLMASSMVFPIVLAPIVLHVLFEIPWWASISSILALASVNFLLASRQSRYFLAFKNLAAERTGLVSEWVQNIRTLRILGWVEAAEKRIFALRRRETVNRKKMVTNGQVMNAIASSSTFILNMLAILLLLKIRTDAGGSAEPTPGELLSLLWILGVFLARPLRQLPWTLVMTFDSLSSVRRLQSAFSIPVFRPSLSQTVGAARDLNAPNDAALSVQGLTLEANGTALLESIDLTLRAGSLVALVGEVGSGKSVILHSLIGGTAARFDAYSLFGESLNGPLDPKAREKIAFVPQEGFTISATLRENVLFTYLDGAPTPASTDDKIFESLRISQFAPEQERVTHGLDSEIGERGVNLSGGQRQRIGLARAHFTDRSILLLDDCLSAVDVDTEKKLIDKLIRGAWKDQTRLIATHRLSILPFCDEVIFLRDGRIEMRGTHEALLVRSSSYREFVRREEKPALAPPLVIETPPAVNDEEES